MKKHCLIILSFLSVTLLTDCGEEALTGLAICNQIVIDAGCGNQEGEYCLFGLKWGAGNNFQPTGVEVSGPQLPGGLVTFSLWEVPTTISNHQETVSTQPFSVLLDCAKEQIRAAFTEWATVANIQFQELPEDTQADITLFVADVASGGNGSPNFTNPACQVLAGQVVFDPSSGDAQTCERFFPYALHEIGHALGLGHTSSGKIMSTSSGRRGIFSLQPGDIAGIRQIYGE